MHKTGNVVVEGVAIGKTNFSMQTMRNRLNAI